jgi:hypothetical protein
LRFFRQPSYDYIYPSSDVEVKMTGSGDGGYDHSHDSHHTNDGGDLYGGATGDGLIATMGLWRLAFAMVIVMCFLPEMTPTVWIVLWSIVGALVVGGPIWDFVRWLRG